MVYRDQDSRQQTQVQALPALQVEDREGNRFTNALETRWWCPGSFTQRQSNGKEPSIFLPAGITDSENTQRRSQRSMGCSGPSGKRSLENQRSSTTLRTTSGKWPDPAAYWGRPLHLAVFLPSPFFGDGIAASCYPRSGLGRSDRIRRPFTGRLLRPERISSRADLDAVHPLRWTDLFSSTAASSLLILEGVNVNKGSRRTVVLRSFADNPDGM